MTEEGKYIYCIINENKEKDLGYIGINNREVKFVPYKDISAVVSNTPVINFDHLDKKELTKHIAIHQKINEEITRDYDVVPMTFGIIAPSVDEVLRTLERAYLQFKAAFKKIEGKIEFAVQVWWDPKKLCAELVSTNPEIRKLKQEASLKTGLLAMPIKLKLGKLIQKEAEVQREIFVKDTQTFLSSLSHDSTSNKLIEDDMIANFSFLVDRVREAELDKKMQELGRKYDGKLRFKYIGPMPPYSFVNINLSLGNFEVVDEARKILKLPQLVSFDEIKETYYAFSRQYHPDKFHGNENQMKKIVQAYSILENYCRSCDKLLGQKSHKYSFKKENVKNSLIIK